MNASFSPFDLLFGQVLVGGFFLGAETFLSVLPVSLVPGKKTERPREDVSTFGAYPDAQESRTFSGCAWRLRCWHGWPNASFDPKPLSKYRGTHWLKKETD